MDYQNDLIKKIQYLIESSSVGEENKVISVSGEWGSGKTYAIKKALSKYESKVAYLSMAGLSIEDNLMDLLAYPLKNQEQIRKRGSLKKVLSSVSKNSNIPAINLVNVMVSESYDYTIASVLKNKIIVIDDLERKCEDLPLKKLSQLIQRFSEYSNIILITNEDELNEVDKNDWEIMKEKFISNSFVLRAMEDPLGVVFKDYLNDDFKSSVLKDFILDIKKGDSLFNLRVIKKILGEVSFYFEVSSLLSDTEKKIYANSLVNLLKFIYICRVNLLEANSDLYDWIIRNIRGRVPSFEEKLILAFKKTKENNLISNYFKDVYFDDNGYIYCFIASFIKIILSYPVTNDEVIESINVFKNSLKKTNSEKILDNFYSFYIGKLSEFNLNELSKVDMSVFGLNNEFKIWETYKYLKFLSSMGLTIDNDLLKVYESESKKRLVPRKDCIHIMKNLFKDLYESSLEKLNKEEKIKSCNLQYVLNNPTLSNEGVLDYIKNLNSVKLREDLMHLNKKLGMKELSLILSSYLTKKESEDFQKTLLKMMKTDYPNDLFQVQFNSFLPSCFLYFHKNSLDNLNAELLDIFTKRDSQLRELWGESFMESLY